MATARRPRRKKKTTKSSWRASWKGELRVGLVRFTVEAVNAHSQSGSDIHFHQLHAACHSRIKYQKVCPIHGEVDQDEIVLGYEYGRGRYVEIDPDELDKMRTKEERALTIDEFIEPNDLDPIYYDGRMYYLAPADANDREPYHLLRRALEETERIGIGQVVFSGKQQLVAVRPRDQLLVMAMLNYQKELRDPDVLGVGADVIRTPGQNLRLAKSLVLSMKSDRFAIGKYEDDYRARVKALIAAKRKGKEVSAPEEEEEPEIINLMDALKESLHQSRPKTHSHAKKVRRRAK